ncbi:MAG: 7-cyano-7-deazaguanine synthase QueC [Rickettsiales bacterium]
MNKKAVLLLSGGLDSATTLAIARAQGFEVYALSFRYGQRHAVELESANKVAAALGAHAHKIADIDLRLFGGSALTADIDVPKDRSAGEMGEGIPITYVPARNTIFLSFALAWAEVLGAYDIFIGVNALDYSGYPDCRPEFIAAFERMANLATAYVIPPSIGGREGGGQPRSAECVSAPLPTLPPMGEGHIKIHTPIIAMTKGEIIREGLRLGVNYSLTISCYDPVDGKACGHCDSCQLRAKGFAENGMNDPALS